MWFPLPLPLGMVLYTGQLFSYLQLFFLSQPRGGIIDLFPQGLVDGVPFLKQSEQSFKEKWGRTLDMCVRGRVPKILRMLTYRSFFWFKNSDKYIQIFISTRLRSHLYCFLFIFAFKVSSYLHVPLVLWWVALIYIVYAEVRQGVSFESRAHHLTSIARYSLLFTYLFEAGSYYATLVFEKGSYYATLDGLKLTNPLEHWD